MAENSNEQQEKHENDEIGIKKLVKEITETNKRIDEAYDEKLRRLEAKKKFRPNEKEEEESQMKITTLRERLNEIRSRISEARKQGKG